MSRKAMGMLNTGIAHVIVTGIILFVTVSPGIWFCVGAMNKEEALTFRQQGLRNC
jgi:hypothetical protein